MNVPIYLEYLKSLNFKPDDIVCVAFGKKDKSWEDNFFQPFNALASEASIAKLFTRNDGGWNIYISMAPFKAGIKNRTKENVSGVRHCWLDADVNGEGVLQAVTQDVNAGILPEPAIAVGTSPGKVQIIWHLSDDGTKGELLNRALQGRYKTDAAVVDSVRVLRMAGFKNNKYDEKPEAIIRHIGPFVEHRFEDFKIEATPSILKKSPAIDGDKIPYGEHDKELTRIAGKLRHDGMEEDSLTQTLIEICEKRCEGFKDDYKQMCEKIAHSVCRYEVGKDYTPLVGGKPAGTDPVKQETAPVISTPSQDVKNQSIEFVRELVDLCVFANKDARMASGRELPLNQKKAVNYATELIYEHIKGRGRIFNADNVGYILLDGQENDPIKVSPDNAVFCNLLTEYGIMPGQDEFVKLGKFIGMKADVEGTKATVRHSSYFNADTKCFYFAESNSIIRGDGTKLERVANGTDGVLFVFEDQYEFKIELDRLPSVKNSLIPEKDSLLMKMLFRDLIFKQGVLTDKDKHILLTVYAMLLILPGIIKGRPVLQMLGESGCGKSFFLMLLGRAIVGSKFTLQGMPSDKEQFENILVNSDIAFFDNVSKVDGKIHDAICSAVTGYDIVRRELFTTMEQVKVPSKTTIGLSALVPVLTTVEQANRSVCLTLLERTEGNLDEDAMLKAFDAQRGALMAEIISRAQMVLQALNAQSSYVPRVMNRLAGVATLILRVARHEGWEDEARAMLNAWNEEQLDKALDYDEVSERIVVWMQNPEWKPGTVYSAGKLHDALRLLPNMGSETDWKGPRSLSVLIHKSKAAYERRFGLKIGDDKRNHQDSFTFNPTQEFLDDIRSGNTQVVVVAADVTMDSHPAGEIPTKSDVPAASPPLDIPLEVADWAK